ncbi:MAG: hypothetical protein V4696_09640 [Pseudomonadota bacterium]
MRSLLLPAFLILAACQTAPPPRFAGGQVIEPALAVMAAADAAPRGYAGRFGFVVRRADMVGPRLFLNSYPDYRDQRNLSVAIAPAVLVTLRARHGNDLRSAFMGRSILVDGEARRERIDFTVGGRPSGKYYFQTHVAVTRPEQIRIVG